MSARTSIRLTLLLVSLVLMTGVHASTTSNRIESVNQLLSVSSAAKKIQSSDSADAKAMLEQAKQMHQQAQEALAGGDEPGAKALLSKSTTTLFKAAKLADGGASVQVKKRADYDQRKKSVEALLGQHRSVAAEKSLTSKSEVIEAEALGLVAEAEVEAKAKRYVEGRALLDQSYELVKGSLVKMRNGEELVMSLNFATPADEYQYYVKKIGSQRQAIGVFSKNITSKGKRKTIDNILGRADADQSKAEALAGSGDYAAALPLMDSVLNKLRSGLMMVVR